MRYLHGSGPIQKIVLAWYAVWKRRTNMSQNLCGLSTQHCEPLFQGKITLALRPSLLIASQSLRDCSDAAGLVSSIWAYLVGTLLSKKAIHSTNIVHPKSVQCFGYSYLGFGIKESICELFPFPKSRFDDLKPRDITVVPRCKSTA